MRGTKSITHGSSTDPRITPACAGNRPFMYVAGYGMKDHPRVCGEQFDCYFITLAKVGSPPRVRGTVRGASWSIHRDRITPACAGNSAIRTVAGAFPADHPRVCGEKLGGGAMKAPFAGSPPRVRGKEQPQPVGASNQRITPACAGNRLSSGDSSRAV